MRGKDILLPPNGTSTQLRREAVNRLNFPEAEQAEG